MPRTIRNPLGRCTKLFLGITLLGLLSPSVNAQTPQKPNTDSALDNRMRSGATVDPLSLSLQLTINLGSYPGRDGLALPITMSYSSRLWGIHHVTTDQCGGFQPWTYYQRYRPEYGRGSMAGWTSPLGMSDAAHGTVDLELYNFDGHPVSTGAYKKVARIFATLPDGSRHELRKDDSLHNPTDTITGKFYAVDDSRLVYDTTTQTLYLPDGTRMTSGFIDKSGNKLVMGGSLYTDWIDTMGRSISSPLDTASNVVGDNTSAVAFDKSFSVPGFNGGTLSYTMKWKKLEDVLTNTSDTLEYMGDSGNTGTCGSYGTGASPSLFGTNGDETQVMMETRVFDPVVLSEIDLPNGQSYHFTYNIYGEISKVVYPTGAYDRFSHDTVPPLNPGLYDGDPFFTQTNRGVVSRTQSEDGTTGTEVTWTYGGGRGVTNPDGTYSTIGVYPGTWAGLMKWGFESAIAGLPAEEDTYNSSGTMLSRHIIERTYDSVSVGGVTATRNPRVTREISVKFEPGDSNALVSLVTYDYDSNSDPAYFADLNPTVVKYYDYVVISASTAQTATLATLAGYFGSSAPAKQVETDYLYDANYQARNLTQIPTEVRVKDASGNVKAKTHFYYDESSYQTTTSGTMPTAASGTWSDPLTELGSTIGSKRALPTTIRSYYDITNGYYIDTHKFYDQYGNVTKVRDGLGKDTTLAFDASYAFTLPTSVTTPVPDSSGIYGSSTAFTSSTAYDYSSGLPTSTTDINGQTTTVSYADPSTSVLDPLLRPRVITAPNGQQTITEYGDTSGSLYVKVSSQINGTNWNVGYKYFDNLGRTIRTRLVDPAGDDYTLACYDNMGRISKVTSPFRGYSTQTCSTTSGLDWTSSSYDAEGRVTAVTTPDTAQVTTAYALATSGSQIGATVTVTDQASKVRRAITNGLGQLIRVDEPTTSGLGTISSPNQGTTYAYDYLNNLTGVTQDSESRSFAYDALSRLTSATNPESGTIGYTYDANGNLTQKTDARVVHSNYTYDALNRNTGVNYTNDPASTPAITRTYDTATNGKGRPASVSSSVGTYTYSSYDALGGVTAGSQTLGSQTYAMSYGYDLAGHVTSMTYPSGRTITNAFDTAGRLSSLTGNLGDGTTRTYATGIIYDAAGRMKKEQLGTDTPIFNKLWYNSRGQLAEIRESTSYTGDGDTSWNRGAIINHYSNYCWGMCAGQSMPDNNGNVQRQEHMVPDDEAVSTAQSYLNWYTYDSLNRLQSVTEGRFVLGEGSPRESVTQTNVFDRWGNRTIDHSATSGSLNPTEFGIDPANTNRLVVPSGHSGTMIYDAAGNLTTDTYSAAAVTRAYDAENRMTTETQALSFVAGSYSYDADGHRVKRTVNGTTTWQVYGMGGELLAEYAANAAAASPQKEYGYRDGVLLITATDPQIQPARQNVSWTSVVGVSVSGNSLTKTASSGWGNAGAVSMQSIVSGDGYVECTAGETNTARMFGLSHGDSTQNYDDIDFAISTNNTGAIKVYEGGVSRGNFGAYTTGDVLRVSVEGGVVKYRKNGTVLYTSSVSPTYPLLVDTSINDSGGTVSSAVISGAVDLEWLVTDQLGTPRIVFDKTGSLARTKRHDYLPFGEELVFGVNGRTTAQGYGGGDGVRQQFTSKERDNETGLDYFGARYYSSTLGRFTSRDPIFVTAKRLIDPQRLNLYAYVRNNPLKFVDTDGMDLTVTAKNEDDARKKYQLLLLGLKDKDRSHAHLVVGDGKNGFKTGEFGVTTDKDYKSDSKNFQTLQSITNDHSAMARLSVIKEGESFSLKVVTGITEKGSELENKSETLTDRNGGMYFQGYTLLEYRGKDEEGIAYTIGDYSETIINGSQDDVGIASAMHHELRHLLLGDFGRSAPRARHSISGQPRNEADVQTDEADTEATKNAKKRP